MTLTSVDGFAVIEKDTAMYFLDRDEAVAMKQRLGYDAVLLPCSLWRDGTGCYYRCRPEIVHVSEEVRNADLD